MRASALLLPFVVLTASCELMSGLSELEKDPSFDPDAAAEASSDTGTPATDSASAPADTGSAPADTATTPPGDSTVADTKPADAGGCGEPMSITFGGHCYFPLTTNRSWADSKAACEAKGAYLAIVTSEAENTAIQGIESTLDRWIGLSRTMDPITKENYKWVDGSAFDATKFDGFDVDEPNDGNSVRIKPTGKWADRDGAVGMFHAICEKG